MFIKPYRVKSHSQMKGSDKKKFKAQVKAQFSIPDSDASILDILLPAKEEALMTKIYTYSGESVIVYSVGKDPLFFEIDKQKVLYPTVYTLWKYPNLMGRNFMSTVAGVISKIANGADLMLPGVVADVENHGMKGYCDGKLKKGDTLYVNVVENKAAIAVGTASQSSEDLYMQGMHGKAVIILHFVGDQLWASGSKTELPDLGRTEGMEFLNRLEDDGNSRNNLVDSLIPQDVENSVGDTDCSLGGGADGGAQESDSIPPSIEDAVASLLLSPVSPADKKNNVDSLKEDLENEAVMEQLEDPNDLDIVQDSEGGELDILDDEHETDEEDQRSPEEVMDDLVEKAFLQALKTTAKKIELPVLISTFFRQHMVPACPSEIGGPIDLKKSSYKKLGKFLSKMNEEKVVIIKEQKKGVEVIVEINYVHEKLMNFRPVKFEGTDNSNGQNEAKGHEKYEPPIITELYLVTAQVSNFFSKCGKITKGDGLTGAEVRYYIREYVNKEELQHPIDPTIINLDPVISDAVLVKGENLVLTFRWDKLASRVTSKMSKGYSIEIKSGNKKQVVVQKGKLEPIEMMLGKRSGNKKVTLIHNLDVYGIDMAEFAHKCQVGVAASTAVHEASNKKRAGGLPVMEVLIQGNQVAFASKLLLEEYNLPRKYIKGIELAAKIKQGGGQKK